MNRSDIIRVRIAERHLTIRDLSQQTGIPVRTLQRRIVDPDGMTLGELRAIHNRLRFSDDELLKFGRSI